MLEELLYSISSDIAPYGDMQTVASIDEALEVLGDGEIDLLVCEASISNNYAALTLLKELQVSEIKLSTAVLSDSADKNLASEILGYRVSDFIVTPFQADKLHLRLNKLVASRRDGSTSTQTVSLDVHLANFTSNLNHFRRLAYANISTPKVADLEVEPSIKQLSRHWDNDPILVGQLIRLANIKTVAAENETTNSLLEAIAVLGVDTAINLAEGWELANKHFSLDEELQKRIEQYTQHAISLSQKAAKLAKAARVDITSCYTAGMLMHLGEYAVLASLQNFINHGGSIDSAQIDQSLRNYASEYAHKIKAHWRLPLALRQCIGAIYKLPDRSLTKDLVVMRLAALKTRGQTKSDEYKRLTRLMGASGR